MIALFDEGALLLNERGSVLLSVDIVVEVCKLIIPDGSKEMLMKVVFDPSEKIFDTKIVPSAPLEMCSLFAVTLPKLLSTLNDTWESSIVPPGSSW